MRLLTTWHYAGYIGKRDRLTGLSREAVHDGDNLGGPNCMDDLPAASSLGRSSILVNTVGSACRSRTVWLGSFWLGLIGLIRGLRIQYESNRILPANAKEPYYFGSQFGLQQALGLGLSLCLCPKYNNCDLGLPLLFAPKTSRPLNRELTLADASYNSCSSAPFSTTHSHWSRLACSNAALASCVAEPSLLPI